MRMLLLLGIASLFVVAPVFAHNPPGPISLCQPATGEAYHDYVPHNTGYVVTGGDGNLADCGPGNFYVGPFLPLLACAPIGQPIIVCTAEDSGVPQTLLDYDQEMDYGHGGVFLAVSSGDGATWGSLACYGMNGHHSGNVYAIGWPQGSGPAFTVTADYSRTPSAWGADCGDDLLEPCDSTPPPPSTQPFPANVVVDTVNAQLYALFGPSGSGTTCNANDCAHRTPVDPATGTRSNPFGATHLVATCAPGIDGVYVVFIEPDLDAPDAPQFGHIWTY